MKITWIIREISEVTVGADVGTPALAFDSNGDTIMRLTQGKSCKVQPFYVSGDKNLVRSLIKDQVQAILECAQEEDIGGGSLVSIFYDSKPMEDPDYGGTAGLVETRISLAYTGAKVEGRVLEDEVCHKLGLPTEV